MGSLQITLLGQHFLFIHKAIPRHTNRVETEIPFDIPEALGGILVAPYLVADCFGFVFVREGPICSTAFPLTQRCLVGDTGKAE